MTSNQKKRILVLSTAYFPFVGGAEVAVKEITDRIGDIEFDMITLRFDSNLPRFEKMGNVSVHRIGLTKTGPAMSDLVKPIFMLDKYLFIFLAFFKAKKLHKKNKYDAVWSIMASYAGFAALFFKISSPNIPFLLTLQEGDSFDHIKKRTGMMHGSYKKIFVKADRIQAISNYLAEYGRDMGFKGEVSVVPNGVDIENFSRKIPESELDKIKKEIGKKEGDIFLVHTGRLVPKNAVADIISSLSYLPENIKFLSIGIGPEKQNLTRLIEEKGLGQRVIMLGFRTHDNLPKYLQASDIFVRPSLSEGLGNSFLEAMAAGLPVIATPVGGIPDFLYDPEKDPRKEPTGLFCKVGDPESISEKVKLLMADAGLRERLVRNAYSLVISRYSWEKISSDMRTFLD